MIDVVEQFRAAIMGAGLAPPPRIESDGKLRRFSTNGKSRDDAGFYILYTDYAISQIEIAKTRGAPS